MKIQTDFIKTVRKSLANPKDIIETPWSVKANIPENWDDILGFLVNRKMKKVEEIHRILKLFEAVVELL